MGMGIHCCPNIFYLFYPTIVSTWRRKCVDIHISGCVETLHELPLLSNNAVSETLLHKSGVLWSVDRIFVIGAPTWRWMGEYVTLDKTFYSLLFKQEVVAAPVTSKFSS